MPEFLFGSILEAGITAQSFAVCLLAALVLGALVAGVYMYKNAYTQSMAVTLALIPALVQVIILLVNGNIGAGVAVSGAFSLVRFRSAAGSARDITCIFLAMTLGLATGMGYIGVAAVTGVAVCLLLVAYSALSFGKKPPVEKSSRSPFRKIWTTPACLTICSRSIRAHPSWSRCARPTWAACITCTTISHSARPRSKSS